METLAGAGADAERVKADRRPCAMSIEAMNARLRASPFNAWLGLVVTQAEAGSIELRLRWKSDLGGRPDRDEVHGGAIASLIDVAGSYALASLHGRPAVTVDLRSDYLRPFVSGEAIARAEILHSTRPLSRVRIVVSDEQQRLLASGTGTYLTPDSSS